MPAGKNMEKSDFLLDAFFGQKIWRKFFCGRDARIVVSRITGNQ
jgi:hypothetical protein